MAVGNGLLATQDGITMVPITGSVAAGEIALYQFRVTTANGMPITAYRPELTKLLHFYLVRDDLTGFQHVHPTLDSVGTWSVSLAPSPAGKYRAYAQFTAMLGTRAVSTVLSKTVVAVGTTTTTTPLPAPSSSTGIDNYELAISGSPIAGQASKLSVTFTKKGSPVTDLQPYLDTYAHLTAFHEKDMAFAHLHPMGSVNGDHGGPKLTFDADFSQVGLYRLFLQFQTAEMLRTVSVTIQVR